MNDDNDGNKPRKPDYINSLYFKNAQGKDQRMDAPNSWKTEDGRIVTKTPLGNLVQTPREMLEDMRTENKDQSVSKDHEHNQEM